MVLFLALLDTQEEQEKFREIYENYRHFMWYIAQQKLKDTHLAEDAVQDAFVRYLEKRPAFRDAGHERAWLLKVTANGCKSRLRARRRHPWVELLDVYPAPDGDSREVLEAVLALPPKQRAAVHLHYYEGYTTDEIAAILGQRPGTVRSHLSRARQALKEQLKGEK